MMNVSQLLTVMFQNYEKQDQTERFDIYVALLSDMPIELLNKTVMKCMREKKFLPSVAEIREECESLVETIVGKPKFKNWDLAWEEIYKGWCNGSPYKPQPQWSTPEIRQTVNSFGWQTLLEARADHTETIRAQMKTIYEMICKRKLTSEKNTNVLLGKSGFEAIGGSIQQFLDAHNGIKQVESGKDGKCIGAGK